MFEGKQKVLPLWLKLLGFSVLLLILTNPRLKDFKEKITGEECYSCRREANFLIFSTYSVRTIYSFDKYVGVGLNFIKYSSTPLNQLP